MLRKEWVFDFKTVKRKNILEKRDKLFWTYNTISVDKK